MNRYIYFLSLFFVISCSPIEETQQDSGADNTGAGNIIGLPDLASVAV